MKNVRLTLGINNDSTVASSMLKCVEHKKIHIIDQAWVEINEMVSSEDIARIRDIIFEHSGWCDNSYDQDQLQASFEDWMSVRYFSVAIDDVSYTIPYDDVIIVAQWINFFRSDEYTQTVETLTELKNEHPVELGKYSVQDMIKIIADNYTWQPHFFTSEFFVDAIREEYCLGSSFGELQVGDELYLIDKGDLKVSLGIIVSTHLSGDQVAITYRCKNSPDESYRIIPDYDSSWITTASHLIATSKCVLEHKVDNLLKTLEQY